MSLSLSMVATERLGWVTCRVGALGQVSTLGGQQSERAATLSAAHSAAGHKHNSSRRRLFYTDLKIG